MKLGEEDIVLIDRTNLFHNFIAQSHNLFYQLLFRLFHIQFDKLIIISLPQIFRLLAKSLLFYKPVLCIIFSQCSNYFYISICMFCMLLFNFMHYVVCILIFILCIYLLVYVLLLLYTFRSAYSVSLYCSVYCLCVNVYCTTATECQTNCS